MICRGSAGSPLVVKSFSKGKSTPSTSSTEASQMGHSVLKSDSSFRRPFSSAAGLDNQRVCIEAARRSTLVPFVVVTSCSIREEISYSRSEYPLSWMRISTEGPSPSGTPCSRIRSLTDKWSISHIEASSVEGSVPGRSFQRTLLVLTERSSRIFLLVEFGVSIRIRKSQACLCRLDAISVCDAIAEVKA